KLTIILLCLISAAVVFSQQPAETRNIKTQRYMLPGKVVSIANDKQSSLLVFFFRANNPDVPGKIPDEMVRKIAELRDTADKIELLANARLEEARRLRLREDANDILPTILKIESKGNELLEKAQKMRNLVNEMMCWRQREFTLNAKSNTVITTRKRFSMDGITLNDKVQVIGNSSEKLTVENNTPDKITLLENIVEVLNKKRANGVKIGELPGGNRDKMKRDKNIPGDNLDKDKNPEREQPHQMVEIIGNVSSLNPLTIAVNGKNVVVDNPAMYGYEKSIIMSFTDLLQSMSIIGQFDCQPGTNQENLSSLYLMMGTTSLFGQDGNFTNMLNTMQKLQL
ncbi:MAG: hypothetical protein WCO98_10855, partial [bacterium]